MPRVGEQSLKDLETVKDKLTPEDYAILKTRLDTHRVQLAFRAPMAMAILHYRRMINTHEDTERRAMDQALQQDIAELRRVAQPQYDWPQEISYLGRTWKIGVPLDVAREQIFQWAYNVDLLRRGIDPRDPEGRYRKYKH